MTDESTILRFRHVLEKHKLAERILARVNLLLDTKGLMLRSATVVEANSLLHGRESDVFAGAGYQGVHKRPDAKASIRPKVEHPFRVIKRQFGHVKVRLRGQAKNAAQLQALFPLAHLWMVCRHLSGILA